MFGMLVHKNCSALVDMFLGSQSSPEVAEHLILVSTTYGVCNVPDSCNR